MARLMGSVICWLVTCNSQLDRNIDLIIWLFWNKALSHAKCKTTGEKKSIYFAGQPTVANFFVALPLFFVFFYFLESDIY